MKRFLERHQKKFLEGYQQVISKRKSWDTARCRFLSIFESVKADVTELKMFENLYVIDSQSRVITKNGLNFVMLTWGRHPVGVNTTDNNSRLVIERGCTLTFSQSIFGDVICIMYPFKSELHKRTEEYLFLSRPKPPDWFTEKRIIKYVKWFFSYSQVSSFIGNPSLVDKLRVCKLITCDKFKKWKFLPIIKDMALELGKAVAAAV